MKLTLSLVLLLLTLMAHARKPAVEDFVGIEPETQNVVPSGTESLYNFADDVKDYQKTGPRQPVVRYTLDQPSMQAPGSTTSSFSLWFGIGFVLALPMITWVVMARHLKSREEASAVTGASIADLAAKRAQKQSQTTTKDDIKKAS